MNDVIRHVGRPALAMLVIAAVWAPAAGAASGHGKASPPGSNGHRYRHGVVPPRGQNRSPAASTASGSGPLAYGGGISNGSSTVGVVTGAPKVYLVFWGSQWGTQGSNAAGNVTLSGDSKGLAPYVESFIKGIGTNSEAWSGVMTQYCQGVATGATSCPSTAAHVGYPTGGAFAGVWVDESAASPSQASGNQIAAEAVKAAGHFGNTTQASNLAAQYVIVSPHGTNPDGFNTATGNFCAWHDYTADSSLTGGAASSPYGYLQFTNLPYIPDAGASCGQNFVNASGPLDGVSIVEGHEYAETITDAYPAGGWTDTTGYENGDKCAWISPGTTGGSFDLSLATGTFAVQTTWGNDGGSGNNGCEASHAIVGGSTGGANTVTVRNPGNQTSTAGSSASLQMTASDSASGQTLTYSATGLPAGLSINSSSGLISGTPTTPGTSSVTVTATDGTGASGNTSFSWTVNSAGGSCTAKQLLGNPGFETGSISPWSSTAGVLSSTSTSEPSHSGSYFAWLDGYGATHTDTLSQSVSVPAGCSTYTLSFWLHIDTAETTTSTAYDTLKVQVITSTATTTLATYSNLNHISGYAQRSFSLAAFAGQTVTVKFTGSEDSSLQTSFAIDDAALNVS